MQETPLQLFRVEKNYISALVLTCFCLTKGCAIFFRPKTIVGSFLHHIVLLSKVLFNHAIRTVIDNFEWMQPLKYRAKFLLQCVINVSMYFYVEWWNYSLLLSSKWVKIICFHKLFCDYFIAFSFNATFKNLFSFLLLILC